MSSSPASQRSSMSIAPPAPRRKRKQAASNSKNTPANHSDDPAKKAKVLENQGESEDADYAPVTEYFGPPEHKPDEERKDFLGVFPFSGTLPVIAEEDEEDHTLSTTIVIDANLDDDPAPEEINTNHDSEAEFFVNGEPDCDEETKTEEPEVEATVDTTLENTTSSKYHTTASRKHANRLNALISKANFISRRVARSAAWRRHFSRIAKSMNLKILPLTPGYNATRWNAEFDSLNRLVQARKVVKKLLADDLALLKSKKRHKGSTKPRGYFHEIFFTPDDWSALEDLTNELSVSDYVS
ncbi:uncharacterized protein MELLADRAFT_112452 [Melampsora larici-populina 98AG31]|uniref:Uncharacterized protein n=1 Tax=Melampsora larici-populina (strain 98AG31 / pathotype 3-4-7) TaxID=747676 RepID=F4S6I7_MELLP|nr:uncharacterized protein MELLADRAFT_112452 [Melampsora larici-populina 98AG31]EGF99751.1 hypothetical protein MELLADRAFT_112452 [Melampsora larici-populina 98AG31]